MIDPRANFIPGGEDPGGGPATPEGVPTRANFWSIEKSEAEDLLGETKPEKKPRKPKE